MNAKMNPRSIIVAFLMAAVVIGSTSVVKAGGDFASLLPSDTLLVIEVHNVNALKENLKKTTYYELYKDPSMQAFVVPAEKKIRQEIDNKLKEIWKEIGMEHPPETLPIPEGTFAVGVKLRLNVITHRIPVGRDESGQMRFVTFRQRIPEPQIVIEAEMGKNAETLRNIITKAVEKAVDEGYKRSTETVRDVELITVSKPIPEKAENNQDDSRGKQEREPFVYAFKGNTLLFSSHKELIKHVLVKMAGAEVESLADKSDYQRVMKKLPAADVLFYLNGGELVNLIKSSAGEEQDKTRQMDKTVRALGLDKLAGIGATVSIAARPGEDGRVRLFIACKGEKTGLLKLLSPKSMPTRPGVLLTSDLSGFVVANYDIGEVFDQIAQMVSAISDRDINQALRQIMAATGGQGEGARPPVDLRKEVLGQLPGPVVITWRIDKPYADPASTKILLAIGVRDGNILNNALGRIHKTFTAPGRKEMTRTMRNITMYLVPSNPLSPITAGMTDRAGSGKSALAVVGDYFVLGSVNVVEQAVRNLGRKDLKNITTALMYRHCQRYLPAQAGVYFYVDGRVSSEAAWVRWKQAAKKRALTDENPSTSPIRRARTPADAFVAQFSKFCDFNKLPDFQAVEKYFGPTIGYVIGTEGGIYAEIISIKAPLGQ